jgi:glucose-1-phosphate cytidylyltransferase
LKRVRDHLDDEDFCFTYGDAVTDINIRQLIEFHRSHDKLATVTAVQQPVGRFGNLAMSGTVVTAFEEKPASDEGWINGGFFILSPEVLERINGDDTTWEHEPLTGLVRDGQLAAFIHNGFWHCMDTQRDRVKLESLWSSSAPWKIW